MKLTISQYLNARSGTPSVNAPVYQFKNPGDTIDADQMLTGDMFSDSAIWYHNTEDNCYYWSGGIDTVEFTFNNQTVDQLDGQTAMQVLSEAKTYYWKKFDQSLNGVSIIYDNCYQLKFQFSLGNTPADAPVGSISFKGFSIKVTTGEADAATFSMATGNRISGSISAIQEQEIGVAGIKVYGNASDNKGWYVLTNYHVAATAALQDGKCGYPYPNAPQIDCVMPGWADQQNPDDKIGTLYNGLFTEWHDIALIRLDDQNNVINTTPDGIDVTNTLDIFKNASYCGRTVTMYANLSGTRDGNIISVNAGSHFNFNGSTYKKDNLIQISHISQDGDSGSPVLLGGALIGLILGDDDTSTYILPIQRIINKFHLSL